MANQYFSCALDVWQDGDYGRNIHARMHYWRSGSYFYQDTSFPNPTMEIAGNVWGDSGFGNSVRSGIYVGDVRTTEYVASVGGNGSYYVVFRARSGLRSDFYGDWDAWVSVSGFPTAPAAPSAWNQTSDGTPHKAHSKVQTSSWGNVSSRKWYEVLNSSKTGTYVYDYNNDPGDLYWTLPNGTNDVNSCAIIKWYGRAYNTNNLYSDSGGMYIATPSAPVLSMTNGSGTNPSTTVSGTIRYKGGTQNSSSCNNGNMKRWQLGKMTSSQSGVPSAFQLDSNNDTATTKSYTWTHDQFTAGTNYKFYIRSVNEYGGTSSSTTGVVYCPTGVSASLASRTTKSLTFRAGYNYAGGLDNATGGTIACYEFRWGDTADNLNHSSGLQTENTYTLSGLVPAQTVYCQTTAWNVNGLSNVSAVTSAMTIPRYDPVVGNATFTPNSPGADVTIAIAHTGGLSEDELTVTGIIIDWKPTSSSTWTNVQTLSGLEISAGETYTVENFFGTSDATEEGDYDVRITVTNGTDTSTYTTRIYAPTTATLTNVNVVENQPIQIRATASMTGDVTPYKYVFHTEGGAGTRVRTFNRTDRSITVVSPNYLLYDTTYSVTATIYNAYGLWRKSATASVTTDKRVHIYHLHNGESTEGRMTFATHTTSGTLTEKDLIAVYYIVANALGDISSTNVGDSMNNKRLRFISDPLHYRPESVASITFTNGKRLSYELDTAADIYKFGIWGSNGIETTFFNGLTWETESYDFPNGYTISAISPASSNLNLSAPFSTTSLTEIPDWDQGA